MAAPDGGDDFVWISDPLKGFAIGVLVIEEAGLVIDPVYYPRRIYYRRPGRQPTSG
jgi:hypothetical protein